ncbi:uncharacterized protein BKCO1_3000200 [Diplodia corticola]|uniref:Uncharacterized protein n=1 Tax=Diplodia corticola TaxID=236234 RepID=A0A1J9REE5_9PEZI|nr:uncharacterized protein BKCO1_3000200 [Diplodia corticola]OJD38904.1 hypothetical protein BKCO1_3000200 [Diplodia corticola]
MHSQALLQLFLFLSATSGAPLNPNNLARRDDLLPVGDATNALPVAGDATKSLPLVGGSTPGAGLGSLPGVDAVKGLTGSLPVVNGLLQRRQLPGAGSLPVVGDATKALPLGDATKSLPLVGGSTPGAGLGGLPGLDAVQGLTGSLPVVNGIAQRRQLVPGTESLPVVGDATKSLPLVGGSTPGAGLGSLPGVDAVKGLTGSLPVVNGLVQRRQLPDYGAAAAPQPEGEDSGAESDSDSDSDSESEFGDDEDAEAPASTPVADASNPVNPSFALPPVIPTPALGSLPTPPALGSLTNGAIPGVGGSSDAAAEDTTTTQAEPAYGAPVGNSQSVEDAESQPSYGI